MLGWEGGELPHRGAGGPLEEWVSGNRKQVADEVIQSHGDWHEVSRRVAVCEVSQRVAVRACGTCLVLVGVHHPENADSHMTIQSSHMTVPVPTGTPGMG